MKIGFDAKRYFNNQTGLGNYSRWLVDGLPDQINPILYSTRQNSHPKFEVKTPSGINSVLSSRWRNKTIVSDLIKDGIQIFHGLSNGLPNQIHKTEIKSVVTIHDLINIRYPEYYNQIDLWVYKKRLKYAIQYADVIITPSEQTRKDVYAFFEVKPKRIEVIPLSVDPIGESKKIETVPSEFILCVSSFNKRKNHIRLIQAYKKSGVKLPLVLAGAKGDTYNQVERICTDESNIFVLDDVSQEQLQWLYLQSKYCVYPSEFEGFGIPILESFVSNKAIALSNVSSLPEVAGDLGVYFNPTNVDEIAQALKTLSDDNFRTSIETQIPSHLEKYESSQLINRYVSIYESLM